MKKIFSYSLFEPKTMPNHRDWDSNKTEKKRYWYNVPTIILLNKFLYPQYKTRFYLSDNIWKDELSSIFKIFDDEIECQTIKLEYSLTEPAIWRMIPLWEYDISILHARDLDSLTSEKDYEYIAKFESSNCTVGTIRSHENHFGHSCRMLAGLCSFKPELVPNHIKGSNFYLYYNKRKNAYGSDQELLIETFTKNEEYTRTNFLDCKIDKQFNKQDFPLIELELDHKFDIENEKKIIFEKIKEYTNCSWLGEPCDSRGKLLNYLLEQNAEIKDKILKSNILSNFYMVKK
jgi:hypothetical protein